MSTEPRPRRNYELNEVRLVSVHMTHRLYCRLKCLATFGGQSLSELAVELLEQETAHWEPEIEAIRNTYRRDHEKREIKRLEEMMELRDDPTSA
jgi:hypothetical protein